MTVCDAPDSPKPNFEGRRTRDTDCLDACHSSGPMGRLRVALTCLSEQRNVMGPTNDE